MSKNKNSIEVTSLKYLLNELNIGKKSNDIKVYDNESIKNIDEKNEIRIELKINEEDVNKNVYFLDNSIFNSYLEELNESNTELFINEKKYEYKKFFIPAKEGNYNIKIKLDFLKIVVICFIVLKI